MYPRATLAATILGSSLAFIDGSVVNVALPALALDLKVNSANLSWAINAYLLPLGVLILTGGALGDHFGRRRLFQIGLSIFALASLACAAAPSLAWLLAARGLQGIEPCRAARRRRCRPRDRRAGVAHLGADEGVGVPRGVFVIGGGGSWRDP